MAKKQLILLILEILRKETDNEHPMTQNEIMHRIEKETGRRVDHKTVRSCLSNLMSMDYPIFYEEGNTRMNQSGEQSTIISKIYYEHEITDGEMHFLINNVLSAGCVSLKFKKNLIAALMQHTSRHFRFSLKNADLKAVHSVSTGEIFLNLQQIGDAIAGGHQLTFCYYDIGTDYKFHPRTGADGRRMVYTVNPYYSITANGRPYLICNVHGHENLAHFRVDRMRDVRLLPQSVIPLRSIKGYEAGMDVSAYIGQHPHLWSGKPEHISFSCGCHLMNDIVDTFGKTARITLLADGRMMVDVHAAREAMLRWAMQYADAVVIETPQSLREELAAQLRVALQHYTE